MHFFDKRATVMELYVFCWSGLCGSCAVGVVGVGDNGVVWEGDGFDAVVVAAILDFNFLSSFNQLSQILIQLQSNHLKEKLQLAFYR